MAEVEPDGVPPGSGETITAPRSAPLIPAPTERASRKVIAAMVGARFGIMLTLSTPLAAGLVLKLQSLLPPEAVIGTLGLITSIGALAALFFDPVFGRISDRTTSRFGRRRPWLVVGSVGVVLALAVIGVAPSPLVVGVGWVLAQTLANAAVSAHTASIADQLPPEQRGKVSGAIGVAQQAASLGAAYAVVFLSTRILLLLLVPGVIGAALVIVYAFVLPDKQLPHRPRSQGGMRSVLTTFWVNPVRHPDFAFTWASRFLLVLANFMFVTVRLLWIQREFGLEPRAAVHILATGVLCYTISLVVAGQIAGWLSDTIGRRKPFIVVSALVFAVGTYMLVHASDSSAFFWAEVVLGVGFGMYVAVDLALVIDVLPNPDEVAKDLRVFNIAMAGPQVLAPALAAILIGVGSGQNYDLMLTAAAVIAVVGALMIVPVKGSK